MIPKTRKQPEKSSTIKIPTSLYDWNALMLRVIERAEKSQDARLPGLRAAHAEGRVEAHLRKMGIISEVDMGREFPLPKE